MSDSRSGTPILDIFLDTSPILTRKRASSSRSISSTTPRTIRTAPVSPFTSFNRLDCFSPLSARAESPRVMLPKYFKSHNEDFADVDNIIQEAHSYLRAESTSGALSSFTPVANSPIFQAIGSPVITKVDKPKNAATDVFSIHTNVLIPIQLQRPPQVDGVNINLMLAKTNFIKCISAADNVPKFVSLDDYNTYFEQSFFSCLMLHSFPNLSFWGKDEFLSLKSSNLFTVDMFRTSFSSLFTEFLYDNGKNKHRTIYLCVKDFNDMWIMFKSNDLDLTVTLSQTSQFLRQTLVEKGIPAIFLNNSLHIENTLDTTLSDYSSGVQIRGIKHIKSFFNFLIEYDYQNIPFTFNETPFIMSTLCMNTFEYGEDGILVKGIIFNWSLRRLVFLHKFFANVKKEHQIFSDLDPDDVADVEDLRCNVLKITEVFNE
ncbi:hypothetical protein PCE1_001142 [Barthelona sp. PCE]